MFGDVQAVSHLVDRIFDVKDAFLVKVKHDLAIFGVIGNIAIGIDLFDSELQRLGHQILHRGGEVNRRAHFRRLWRNKGVHNL